MTKINQCYKYLKLRNKGIYFYSFFSSGSSSSSSSQSNESSDSANETLKLKKVLDRSELMDNMLFPENCSSLCIVPSNKEGTGFLNHCYDSRFLTDYMSEKEFNSIVAISSKLCARAYSKKKMMDRLGIPKRTKSALIFSTLLAMTSLFTVLYSVLDTNHDNTLLVISHVLIAPSLIIMFLVT